VAGVLSMVVFYMTLQACTGEAARLGFSMGTGTITLFMGLH